MAVNQILSYVECLQQMPGSLREERLRVIGSQLAGLRHRASGFGDAGYAFNYLTGRFEYMDDSIQPVCGHPGGAFMEGGGQFVHSVFMKEDRTLYSEQAFPANAAFLASVPAQERHIYRTSITYRFLDPDKKAKTILQRHIVPFTDDNGNPLVSVGSVMDITPFKTDNRMVHRIERLEGGTYVPVWQRHYFPIAEECVLSKREKEVLHHVMDGLNSHAIADKLNLSLHTVKTHRRNMLEKTNAKNTADLIRYAIAQGLV